MLPSFNGILGIAIPGAFIPGSSLKESFMTTLALAAPTVNIISGVPGSSGITGVTLPASETAFASYNALTVPNNGSVLLRVVTGAGDAPVFLFVVEETVLGVALTSATLFTQTLGANTTKIYGPFSPRVFNDANGLLNVSLTGGSVTNTSVGAYILPGAAA
jgi:hypothetical protein